MAWLTGWGYRKSHTITGTAVGAQTEYQMGVKVYFSDGVDGTEVVGAFTYGKVYLDGKCETDFGDIRFTEDDGETELDYWMEEMVDSDYAIFWVEVASIPSDPDLEVIYVYYGKAGEPTTSDGDDTFILFDDFNDDSFDTTKWQDVSTAPANVTESSQRLHCNYAAGSKRGWARSKNEMPQKDILIHVKAYISSSGGAANIVMQWDGQHDPAAIWDLPTNGFFHDGYSTRKLKKVVAESITDLDTDGGAPTGTWNLLEFSYYNTDLVVLEDGGEIESATDVHNFSTLYMGLFSRESSINTDWDDFYVRKFVDPEPSHTSWGFEEGQQADSEELKAGFDGQVSLDLPAEFIVQQADYKTLLGKFIAQHKDEKQLKAGFNGQVSLNLLGKFIVQHKDYETLKAGFDGQVIENLLGKFIAQHKDEDYETLLGKFVAQQADYKTLLGKFIIQQASSKTLKAGFDGQVTENLLGKFVAQQADSETLLGKFIVQQASSETLKASFDGQVTENLLGKFIAQQVDSETLLGEFISRQSASTELKMSFWIRYYRVDLLAGFYVRPKGSMATDFEIKDLRRGLTIHDPDRIMTITPRRKMRVK